MAKDGSPFTSGRAVADPYGGWSDPYSGGGGTYGEGADRAPEAPFKPHDPLQGPLPTWPDHAKDWLRANAPSSLARAGSDIVNAVDLVTPGSDWQRLGQDTGRGEYTDAAKRAVFLLPGAKAVGAGVHAVGAAAKAAGIAERLEAAGRSAQQIWAATHSVKANTGRGPQFVHEILPAKGAHGGDTHVSELPFIDINKAVHGEKSAYSPHPDRVTSPFGPKSMGDVTGPSAVYDELPHLKSVPAFGAEIRSEAPFRSNNKALNHELIAAGPNRQHAIDTAAGGNPGLHVQFDTARNANGFDFDHSAQMALQDLILRDARAGTHAGMSASGLPSAKAVDGMAKQVEAAIAHKATGATPGITNPIMRTRVSDALSPMPRDQLDRVLLLMRQKDRQAAADLLRKENTNDLLVAETAKRTTQQLDHKGPDISRTMPDIRPDGLPF